MATSFAQGINELTQEETDAGYDLLFNGKDLSNWHAYRKPQVTDAWTVKTNAPLGARIENGDGTKDPILTNKKYKNFDIKMEVQTPANGNSGIFTRYEETATSSANARSGPEYQVCGPSHSDCAGGLHTYGTCYDMFPVKSNLVSTWYKAPGNWNQIRIIAYDSNYVHYGNGKKLLEYKIGSADFLRAYNASKYVSDGNNGRYYDIHAGGILLQHHGETGITFRNMKAKELTVHPFLKDFPDGKWPDTLSQDFVFEKATVGLTESRGSADAAIALSYSSEERALIRITGRHVDVRVLSLSGKVLPYTRLGGGEYAVDRRNLGGGIALVRAKVDGKTLSRLITLP